ncbi:MAG: hypothetical protein ABI318_09945 [Chthoniobacteraceae bacterium]
MRIWLKALFILLMVAGFMICAAWSYMAYVEGNMPYPNGDMTEEEIARDDAIIARSVRLNHYIALAGATVGVISAFALRALKKKRPIN